MPFDYATLKAEQDALADALLAAAQNPKPTYSVQGQMFDWAGYVKMLTARQQAILGMMASIDGPYEIEVEGM